MEGIWPGHRGYTPTLYEKCHGIFNDHRESGPRFNVSFTFTFMHLADAFIQSDLHCIQVTVFTFYQLLLSLGIEPMILALLAPCSTIWATGKRLIRKTVLFDSIVSPSLYWGVRTHTDHMVSTGRREIIRWSERFSSIVIAHSNFLWIQMWYGPMKLPDVTQDVLKMYDLGSKPQITLNHSWGTWTHMHIVMVKLQVVEAWPIGQI